MIAHIEKRPTHINNTKGLYYVVKVQPLSGPSFELRMPCCEYDRLERTAQGRPEELLQEVADAITDFGV